MVTSISVITTRLDPVELSKRLQNPGPGSYRTITTDPDGKYIVSTIK